MNENLLVHLNEFTKITESLKAGVKITPEILKKHASLVIQIVYQIKITPDSSVIPVFIDSFLNREEEEANQINWDLFVLLGFFDKKELKHNALEGLHSNNPGSRLWSIILLRKYNQSPDIYNDKFKEMLKDPEINVRYEALISLAICAQEPHKYLNKDILEDPSHKIKTFANILYRDRIGALHTILSELIPFDMEKMEQNCNGKPMSDAEEILEVLAALRSTKSIPYFLEAYLPNDGDGLALNDLIEKMLGNFAEEELLPYLLHALEKGNLGSKTLSLIALGSLEDPSYIPKIKQFLVHENEDIRMNAVKALSFTNAPSVLPDLVYAMKHDLSLKVREMTQI